MLFYLAISFFYLIFAMEFLVFYFAFFYILMRISKSLVKATYFYFKGQLVIMQVACESRLHFLFVKNVKTFGYYLDLPYLCSVKTIKLNN